MRCLVASAVGVCAICASTANAYFTVASNLPVAPTSGGGQFMVQNGNYSDALNSDGEYFNGLGLAQGFTTVAGYSLDRLTVWGCSDYFGNNSPWTATQLSSNITGFQVVLMKQNGLGAYVTQHTWNIGIGSVTQTATGNYSPSVFDPIFSLGMNLGNFTITQAGIYYLAVGAVLANGDGDSWQWTNGQWDGTESSHPYIATTADTPTSWGQWSGVPNGVSGSMLLESTVPGPGVLSILASGVFAGGRRRRR